VLEKNLQGDIFSSLELLQIRKFMQIAFDENSNSENAQVSSAVVIVDPDINSVIAQAHTDSSHPLKHAAMLCLDQVASVQGGGVWEKRHGSRHGEQTALNTEKQLQERSIDLAIAEDLKCPPAKRAKCHDQYLCTGYDVYCTTEPCIMCCMALLHSRVHRVFFCNSNPPSGGLCSQYKIHSHTSLNHHFKVYKCVLS
jgi:tRNA-specific adenosine deaminase 3